MTRVEADELVAALEELVDEHIRHGRIKAHHGYGSQIEQDSFHVMNAARERLIDRLCGEERTDALPVRAP